MDENQKFIEALAYGVVKGVSENLEKSLKLGKKGIDKVKVKYLGTAFKNYLEKSYEKYSTVKTFLNKREPEPQKLRNFYVTTNLQKGEIVISAVSSEVVRGFSGGNFTIVQGTGGIGKSMLMKHLFLSELEAKKYMYVPVIFELKDINDQKGDYHLKDAIFEDMNILDDKTSKDAIEYALKEGLFMILLDGLDEIDGDKQKDFMKKLNDFCDRYPDNHVIMSTRPIRDEEKISYKKFTVLDTLKLDKPQAISLIEKLVYNKKSKERFIKALDEGLFEKHEGFASNPLLLTMMFLNYDEFGGVAEAPHIFYEDTFDVLLRRHDSTKEGYERKMESGLKHDAFKKVFATFCCITYLDKKYKFSESGLIEALERTERNIDINFDPEKYIMDLTSAVCMLYKEGREYHFTHRSFQEYFTAVYLLKQTDDVMEKLGLEIIRKSQWSTDRVFSLLRAMSENRFEKNIVLPLLNEIEKDFDGGDKYDFYFKRIVRSIDFQGDGVMSRTLYGFTSEEFILRCYIYGMNSIFDRNISKKAAEDVRKHLGDDLSRYYDYIFDDEKVLHEHQVFVGDDGVLYDLLRKTWIGQRITALSKARETLSEKYDTEATQDDFFKL